MAPKKAAVVKKAPKARKSPSTKAKKEPDTQVADDANIAENDEAQKDSPADIFTTFSTDVNLKEGLSVVRSLGGGKYEIVSLDGVSQNVIGSNEAAELIKSVPERQNALDISKKQWDAAIVKCDVAVRITSKYFLDDSISLLRAS